MPRRKRAATGAAKARKVTIKQEPVEAEDDLRLSNALNVTDRRQAYSQAPQMGTHILFLFVGEARQLLTIHTDVLHRSTKAHFNTRFEHEQACWLREEDPAIASLWRSFLYTGDISSIDETSDQDEQDYGHAESHMDGEWSKLAHCYLFGQVVQDETFATAAVTALIEKVEETERFPTGIASEVYAYTQPGDKLRALIVDLHVWMGEGMCLVEPHEDADGPKGFLLDVIAELAEAGSAIQKEGKRLWESDRCAYHEHRSTRRCDL